MGIKERSEMLAAVSYDFRRRDFEDLTSMVFIYVVMNRHSYPSLLYLNHSHDDLALSMISLKISL